MNPIIGIIMCGISGGRQFVSHPYIRAIERSGGIPLLIPFVKNRSNYSIYCDVCDGFLFCGGGDITPVLFGEDLLTDKGSTDISTDLFQLSFMEHILDTDIPILGICRGMQILNVALGGTIYQDISLKPSPSLQHMQSSEKRSDVSHQVVFQDDSLLYNILGNTAYTNSFHHQSIHALGNGLTVTGSTSDLVIEAVESTSHPFRVGVQWHPECLYDTVTNMNRLFFTFIEAAQKGGKSSVSTPESPPFAPS